MESKRKYKVRFSEKLQFLILSLAYNRFKVGPGFRLVLPHWGRGCGRQTARRSACPVVGATGTTLHFPVPGKWSLYPYSSSPHKVRLTLWGPLWCLGKLIAQGRVSDSYGRKRKVSQKFPPTSAQRRLFLPGGVLDPARSETPTHRRQRLHGWVTVAPCTISVPQSDARDARFRGRFSASLCGTCVTVPRTEAPPTAVPSWQMNFNKKF